MWPFSKRLEDVIYKTISVRIHGVKFLIKKLDPANHLEGNKVMLQLYDIYKVEKRSNEAVAKDMEKVRAHYKDVFLCSVVEPKLARKEGDAGLPVEHLFTEWDFANDLYAKIMEYTYGKKKMTSVSSDQSYLTSTSSANGTALDHPAS